MVEIFYLLAAKQLPSTGLRQSSLSLSGADKYKLIVDKELDSYLNCLSPDAIVETNGKKFFPSPFLFWLDNSSVYPFISKIAFTILATPATSCGSEREFSNAGWLCSGKRNKLTAKNLSAEVFLSCNNSRVRKRVRIKNLWTHSTKAKSRNKQQRESKLRFRCRKPHQREGPRC